jgi:hypothetical protein
MGYNARYFARGVRMARGERPADFHMTAVDAAAQELPRQSALRAALAGLIGNVLEWFDYAVYDALWSYRSGIDASYEGNQPALARRLTSVFKGLGLGSRAV